MLAWPGAGSEEGTGTPSIECHDGGDGLIQAEARAQVRQLLPRIVREEIAIYLGASEARPPNKRRGRRGDQTLRFLKGVLI